MHGLPPWLAFFTFPTVNVIFVTLGCMLIGITAGTLGCFAYLRKRSLLGDALAHAALPGVCVAFLLTGTKDPLVVLLGAVAACWLGAITIDAIVAHTRVKEDSALGMVLSVYFGFGILLLTNIQQSGNPDQAGLDAFLFGEAASMVRRDVLTLATAGGITCFCVALAYKELKLLTFDPDFAHALGFNRRLLEILLSTLIVVAVAIGLQAVGVVLMAAMLVTPAAAARYWTDRLGVMLILAAAIGAASGFMGAYASYLAPRMPTGPWMVLAASGLFAISMLVSPRAGVLPRLERQRRQRRRTAGENVMRTLYLLGERSGNPGAHYSLGEVIEHRPMLPGALRRVLRRLERGGWVHESPGGLFALTGTGRARAERLTRLHRLWELYLTRKLDIAPDHVHDDAEEIEHILTPELEARLLAALDHPEEDPHARAIPGLPSGSGLPRREGPS